MSENQYYINPQGYKCFKNSNKTLHRYVAKKEIWEKNRKKYPLEFWDYQVHHKDGIKLNNKPENLELIPRGEHEKRHGIIRREQLQINYMKAGVLWLMGIILVEWVSNLLIITGWRKALMFIFISISAFAFMLWVSREKEDKKYI